MVALPQEGGEPIRDNGRRVPSTECGDQGFSASGLPHSNNQEQRELNFKSDSLTKTTPVVINPHISHDYPDGNDVEPHPDNEQVQFRRHVQGRPASPHVGMVS